MKKTMLTLWGFLVIFMANAQTPKQTIQNDSLLKKVAFAAKTDAVAYPEIAQPLIYNQSLIYKQRLDSIQKIVPLSYNEYVQGFIDRYSKRKELMGKMLGLSGYYFPIFEKALRAFNIPTEIKYLTIIESEMNPQAVSRVGATGIWQFMFSTAKAYRLNIDNYVDERKDPIQASYAAAAYFRDAYEELGDWLLAIAAYNCGKGNVTRAIAKAGSRDFWEIRRFLPRETRDYVPAFIAAVYVMNYADSHQITKQQPAITYQIDTIQVNRMISLTAVANAIHYDENTLFGLNPSYKKKIVNGTIDFPKRIILPKVAQTDYARLYTLLTADEETGSEIQLASVGNNPSKIYTHKVKPGQTLASIAELYQIDVQDLKVWNKLKSNSLIPGQFLKIYTTTPVPKTDLKPTFISYKVKVGDTLASIAEKFDGATVDGIKRNNNLSNAILQPGMVLKIKG